MAHQPRSIDVTHVVEWRDGEVRRVQDYLVAEEPLEIRIGERALSVTMRTPGHDLELAAGFLFSEGIVQAAEQIRSLDFEKGRTRESNGNVVRVELAESGFDPEQLQRNFYMTSSCGICGKASIEAVRARGLRRLNSELVMDPNILCTLPEQLKSAQKIFGHTGGLHAAGLFSRSGELIVLREDVGRHNAVDKIVGWALLEKRLPLEDGVLMVSGRGGFEIIQKAALAGIPLLASVSAPSGLAVRLARETGMTLVGFLRGRRFLIYSGEQRVGVSSSVVAEKEKSGGRGRASAAKGED
ncbi:MAG TPA: formate dehydrogenase accessory sulfurtransferase FdhD [Terriglobales bacterium]|nr:formate dehydrogenase accessory sulfurtransferase FdhD [Terriglobales bacterium]